MELKKDLLYFDYNATTPVDKRVVVEMLPYMTDYFGNPSSNHNFGDSANKAVEKSRKRVADLIGADNSEIFFTSGSTESINIALKGVSEISMSKGRHIITGSTEHNAVLETCRYLEKIGYEVTYLPVNKDGLIDLNSFKKSLREDTSLVCVMYVNNETGVIQPIKEIAKLAHSVGAFFMTDATQAVGKIEINVDDLGVDLLCLSGHKMYAPKGIGALYIRNNINPKTLTPLFHGGGQENSLRSGTLNVPGIIGLGKACELALNEMQQDATRIEILRNKLENELLKLRNTFLNGHRQHRIFNTTNICFQGTDANLLISRLKNVAASNGSACTSSTIEPSHVLISMGLIDDDAHSSIRFSLGKYNVESEVDYVVKTISDLIKSYLC